MRKQSTLNCEFYTVTVSGSFLGPNPQEITCPSQWSFNQLKCFLLDQSKTLVLFHQFMISIMGKVPNQQTNVGILLKHLVESGKKVHLYLTNIVDDNSLRFQDYYLKKISQFSDRMDQEWDGLGIQDGEQVGYLPVMNKKFQVFAQSLATNTYLSDKHVPLPVPEAAQAPENRFDLGNIARVFIISSIALSLSSQATVLQMVIIISLLILHFVVGRRRAAANLDANQNNPNAGINPPQNVHANPLPNTNIDNANPSPQNEGQQEHHNKRVNQTARKLKRMWVITLQFFYVYFLSLFPNWKIEEHYLEKYKQQIKEYEAEYQKGNPESQSKQKEDKSEAREEELVEPENREEQEAVNAL